MSDPTTPQIRKAVMQATANTDKPIPVPRYALGQIVWKVSSHGIGHGVVVGRRYSEGANQPGEWAYTVRFEGSAHTDDHGESFLFESVQDIADHFQALACEEREKKEGKR